MTRDIPPIHPGEVLEEEFLDPLGISAYRLAKATCVPQDRVSNIVHGRRGVTADTALRFGRFFGLEPQFWLDLQVRYDLEVARETLGEQLAVTPFQAVWHAAQPSDGSSVRYLHPPGRTRGRLEELSVKVNVCDLAER